MNSRERFLAGLLGKEQPDRTPLAHISALTTVELQRMTHCYMPRVHHEPEQLVKLCVANHEILGFDGVTFIINYFNEPAALGCEMRWGNERELPMYTSHPWFKMDEVVIPQGLLDREPIRNYLRALHIAKKKYGDEVAILGKIMGPFSMAQVMCGVENFMIGMIEQPERARYFLDICTEILIKCANAQFAEGIDALAVGEGGAGHNMLSAQMHEKFLLNAHKKMVKEINGPIILHICGDITPRLDLLAQTGVTCFNFDWNIEPKIIKRVSQGRFKIMGNISTLDLLRAKPEQIEIQITKCLQAEVDIISPGCAVSPECPNANFQAMANAIQQYRRRRRYS